MTSKLTLIRLAQSGDTAAHEKLLLMCNDFIIGASRKLCQKYFRNNYDADDIAQACRLKMLEKIGQFREESNINTWIYQIIKNAVLDLHKNGKRFVSLDEEVKMREDGKHEGEEMVIEYGAADMRQELVPELLDLKMAIVKLQPRQYRKIFFLRFLFSLSDKEIATIMGFKSPDVTKNAVYRIRRQLAAAMNS